MQVHDAQLKGKAINLLIAWEKLKRNATFYASKLNKHFNKRFPSAPINYFLRSIQIAPKVKVNSLLFRTIYLQFSVLAVHCWKFS